MRLSAPTPSMLACAFWTERASDHWSPLWDSLGQNRDPGAGLC